MVRLGWQTDRMSIENPKLVRMKEILAKCGSDLAGRIDPTMRRIDELDYAMRRAVADVLMDEFLREGMTPDHAENGYGLEIESLVDSLELSKRF